MKAFEYDFEITAAQRAKGSIGAVAYDKGIAEGKAEGKADAVLTVLRARFKKVPRGVEKSVRNMSDPIALDSWTQYAATCKSLDEFDDAIR